MIPARRPNASPVFLLTAALVLLVTSVPARSSLSQLITPTAGIPITAVSTVRHEPTLVPTLLPTQPPATMINEPEASAGTAFQMPDDLPGRATFPAQAIAPLVDPSLSLLWGPVDVPLQIQIPALNIDAPVIGVGLTLDHAMASPLRRMMYSRLRG